MKSYAQIQLQLSNLQFDEIPLKCCEKRDFNCSVIHPADGSAGKINRGGNICCPLRLLDNIEQLYTPKKADDYHSYFLLVNELHFRASVKGFHSQAITPESPFSHQKEPKK